jgi:hypothetical protein
MIAAKNLVLMLQLTVMQTFMHAAEKCILGSNRT